MLNLPNKKILKVLLVAIVLVVSYFGYIYVSSFLRSKNSPQDFEITLAEGEYFIESFPPSRDLIHTTTSRPGWVSTVIQGKVNGFSEYEGNKIVKFGYVSKANEEVEANVLLSINKTLIPTVLKNSAEGPTYYDFNLKYLDEITVWDKFNDSLSSGDDRMAKRGLFNFDEFKQEFPEGSLVSIRFFSQIPDTAQRTEAFCNKADTYFCALNEIQDKFNYSTDNLWKGEPKFNEYYLPLDIYRDFIKDEK